MNNKYVPADYLNSMQQFPSSEARDLEGVSLAWNCFCSVFAEGNVFWIRSHLLGVRGEFAGEVNLVHRVKHRTHTR